jgi:predicted ATP-grasp superfamily ATP-dependent carboligase
VIAIAFEDTDPVLHSRYPAETIKVPGASAEEKEANLLEILGRLPHEGAAILATSDRLVSLMSNHRAELLQRYRFQMPAPDIVDALNDKSREIALVSSVGVAVPRTIEDLPSVPESLEGMLRYPIIIKPHSFGAMKLFPKRNAVIRSSAELAAFYAEWAPALHAVLAQEVIPGPMTNSWVCSCTYDADHELLDCLVRQKLRTIPADFGTSTFSVCRENPQIVELARSLGRRLEYVGHAGIEFRWDDRDGQFKYIELNPRIGGEVGFDEACGLPTVWNSYLVALGKEASCSGNRQDNGRFFVNLNRDLISLRSQGASIPRIAAIHLLLLFKRRSGLYFAWDDVRPGLVVAYRFLVDVSRALVRRLAPTKGQSPSGRLADRAW